MKIFELLAVMPDEQIAALAIVPAVFIGMRLLYGAWPWESRKTWYRTKPFVPVRQPPAQINSDAKETPVDTDNDHFDRKLITANGDSPTDENAPSTICVTGGAPSALRKKGAAHPRPHLHRRQIRHLGDRASNNSGSSSYSDKEINSDHASPQ